MSKSLAQRTSIAITLAVAAPACGGATGHDPQLEVTDRAITGAPGQSNLVTSAQNQSAPYTSVINYSSSTIGGCTATKIRNGGAGGRDRFLTAGHCVDGGLQRVSIYSSIDGSSSVGRDLRAIFRHPSCRSDPGAGANCANARSTSYDVAIFEVDNISTIPVLSLDSAHIGSGSTNRFIGYGCNEFFDPEAGEEDWTGLKQQATDATASQGSTTTANFTRYIKTAGIPHGCEGDSGGPLLATTSPFRVRGVTSFRLGDPVETTHFARVSNLINWIASPHKLNVIQHNESGFLQNRAARKCLELNGSGETALLDCAGPTSFQYWRLTSTPNGFMIDNPLQGTCLSVSSNTVIQAGCNVADTKQRWIFSEEVVADPGVRYLSIKNASNGRYLARSPNASDTPLQTIALAFGDTTQHWYFYP